VFEVIVITEFFNPQKIHRQIIKRLMSGEKVWQMKNVKHAVCKNRHQQ